MPRKYLYSHEAAAKAATPDPQKERNPNTRTAKGTHRGAVRRTTGERNMRPRTKEVMVRPANRRRTPPVMASVRMPRRWLEVGLRSWRRWRNWVGPVAAAVVVVERGGRAVVVGSAIGGGGTERERGMPERGIVMEWREIRKRESGEGEEGGRGRHVGEGFGVLGFMQWNTWRGEREREREIQLSCPGFLAVCWDLLFFFVLGFWVNIHELRWLIYVCL